MKSEIVAYSSVKGLLHQMRNMANQDSYLVKKYKFGTVMVVSDGMGSHKYSDVGSQGACKSVRQAIHIWQSYKNKDIRLLIPLIHSFWSMEIYPYSKSECGATCLFAFISKDNKLYIAQLGDGNIYLSIDNDLSLIHTKEDEFSNFTSSLSNISSFEDWIIKEYDIANKHIRILLMTDGVSETLIEDKKDDFVRLVWSKIKEKDNLSKRNNFLHKLLTNWNTINAGDDRTIVSYEKY